MQLWQDGWVAALAAVGLCSLLWCVIRIIWSVGCPRCKSALAVIPASGDGSGLQEQIYALTGFGREQGLIGRILVVDCGLDAEGQKLCSILERENRWVMVCAPHEIADQIKIND